MLALDWDTPGCVVREETKLQAMKTDNKSQEKVLKFEVKIRLCNELLKECLVEIEKDKQNETR